MIYDYENETHGAVHVIMSRMCRICHMFGVESTQSYQLTELRFQGSGKHNGSRRVSMLEIRVCTLINVQHKRSQVRSSPLPDARQPYCGLARQTYGGQGWQAGL